MSLTSRIITTSHFSLLIFLMSIYIPLHIPRTQRLSLGHDTVAIQLEKDGLRGILTTLYVFSPGASKPGDKPCLLNT